MIAALFGQLSQPAKLKALNLTEVLDWATDALNRVDQIAFFKTFESTRSIQYFYEPFLAAFDPELRKSLGVWYTPEEIVRYQVARVDQVLQSELGLPDGLADPNVVVLDPCCGTGAYLVEVLRVMAEKLKAQGADALAAHQLKQAATTRLFGFELLPAPYVVAHLQIGLLLRQLGAPLEDDERAGIYLTNALTGWEPAKAPKNAVLPFPEFEQERDAADQVKQTQKIIVILGNPPYDAFGGVALGEEQDLVTPYKEGLIKKWGVKKFNLDDLYVRFFRLAERRIAERGGRGVVCYLHPWRLVRRDARAPNQQFQPHLD
jgi:predicted helicase